MKILLERVATTDLSNSQSETFIQAAQRGNESLVNLDLYGGAAVNMPDVDGQTPLTWAAKTGRLAVVKTLLGRGAAISPKDKDGRTPLDWAGGLEHKAIVQALLEKGASI